MNEAAARIEVKDLVVRYGDAVAVNGVSFTVGRGEHLTLLGPSGCGKTTTLRAIAGLEHPSAGRITIDGRAMYDGASRTNVATEDRGVSMVFQSYAVWPHMTVFDNVAYGLRLRHTPGEEVRSRVEAVLGKVRLAGLGERYPGQLSGGQQQRVALARALVLNPKILLLDEPLSNLDAKIRIQVRAEIRKLQKELGITTVYVTHDQEEALTLSDRIAVFNEGRVFQVGSPRDLYQRPVNRFVADFIGINNLVDGTVRAVGNDGLVAVDTAAGTLRAVAGAELGVGAPCVVCFRPENVDLDGAGEGERNRVHGKIAFAAYLGNTLRYDADLGHAITVKADDRDPWHHEPLAMGREIALSFPVGATLAIKP